jgi:Tol biopolymer transport system component
MSTEKVHKLRWAIVGLAILGVLFLVREADAQSFGKNKVQYTQFHWRVASSKNFDVYFYTGEDTLATVVLDLAEQAVFKLSDDLGHRLHKKVPIIIYESHYDFEQTNVITELIEEGVGGFTEIFKNRVVVPFSGSYEELRHVVVHELTHAFMFDMMYTGIFDSILSAEYLYQIPLWFSEGLAEYEASGWDETADMVMRDAAVSGYAVHLDMLGGGYLVYKQGQSAIDFLVRRYGKEKLRDIIGSLRTNRSLENAFQRSLGMGERKFSEAWMEALRKQYWPEVAVRDNPEKFGRRITDHKADGSFLNLSPAVSPKGDRLVFLSDRAGDMDICLASAIDGKILRRLVRGEKSMRFEVIPSFRNSLTWSPDEKKIAFVAKSGKGDVLYLLDVNRARVSKRFRLKLNGVSYPNWSPDGKKIVLTGLMEGKADLYVLNLETGVLERLTDDLYDDIEANWSPDGKLIAFASDRRLPFSLNPVSEKGGIGTYAIYTIDPVTREVTEAIDTRGSDRSPTWSPDGSKIIFTSSPDGVSDLFAFDLRDSSLVQLTDVLGGIFSPSWSKSDRLAFSLFSDAGWDVYVAKEPLSLKAVMDELVKEGQVRPITARADTSKASATVSTTGTSAVLFPSALSATMLPVDTLVARADSLVSGTDSSATLAPGIAGVARAKPYRVTFSPEWVTGGFQYTSAYGFGGSTEFSLSDFLGNHRIYVASDFFSSIEETDILGIYYYLPRRLDLGVGGFHYKNYYYSRTTALGEEFSEEKYFSERNYGLLLLASYPFGKFNRVELDFTHLTVDRQFYEYDPYTGNFYPTESGTKRVLSPGITFVGDTVQWGMFGPVAGSRWALAYSSALKVSDKNMDFRTTWADLRKYFRVARGYSFAFRLVGAMSDGTDAQRFFAGGPYTLRGYEDFQFTGTRVVFLNSEFRFPFIERVGFVWPLPVGLTNIEGILFFDIGAAWSDDKRFRPFTDIHGFHMDTKYGGAALGTGIRTNLSFIIIKLDFAWRSDLNEVAGYRTHVSIGGEF